MPVFADILLLTPIVFVNIAPDIVASPTISRETAGVELPIPMRALPPPTKYILLVAFKFVPN